MTGDVYVMVLQSEFMAISLIKSKHKFYSVDVAHTHTPIYILYMKLIWN